MKACLNMIVRNEAATIERCLNAAAPHISGAVIVDTMSTDATVDVILGWSERNGVPVEVHSIEFYNFGQARTDALSLCRASSLCNEYIVLLDADHEMTGEALPELSAGVYNMEITGLGLSYWLPRLLRAAVVARFVGSTHEYLEVPPGTTQERVTGVRIIDRADGGCRADKFERDIRLLSDELVREPDNPRAVLYLANSMRDAGRPADAIPLYRRRTEMGGWDEEIWYALYQIAVCHQRIGDVPSLVTTAWDAYAARPWRAEPLYLLARHHRLAGQHDVCMAVCEIARQIQLPTQDSLFIETWIYSYGILEEMSIAGFYCGADQRVAAGAAACRAVAECTSASAGLRMHAVQNLAHYRRRTRLSNLSLNAAYEAPTIR